MIKDRKKASDIFRESNLVFAKKSPFKEAYPEIDDLTIEVNKTSHHNYTESPLKHHFSIENPPGEYIDCDNPLCYNGGFSIGSVLRRMVSNKETQKEGSGSCQGYEGSPKGRRRYRSCLSVFRYKANIKYKK